MTDWIDQDSDFDDAKPRAKSAVCDDTMTIRFTDWTRADRARRQIIEAIYSVNDLPTLDEYVEAEDLLIDALFLFDPAMAASIREAHQDVQDMLSAPKSTSRFTKGEPGQW
jgi:hypothetical protein